VSAPELLGRPLGDLEGGLEIARKSSIFDVISDKRLIADVALEALRCPAVHGIATARSHSGAA